MSGNIKGDFGVSRTLTVGRRVNEGFAVKTLSGPEQLDMHAARWQALSASSAEDVILPDASTLPVGWQVTVSAAGAATITVKTFDAAAPVLLQAILSGRAYAFVLLDNGTAAGQWHVNFLEDSETVVSDRYLHTFNDASDWGAASAGYYSITVPASAHGRGVQPGIAGIFAESGSDFVAVEIGTNGLVVSATGDVTIKVPESPDCRFAGKIVFV